MSQKQEPWELYPHIWKNQSAFFTFMRGALRRALWERNPIKLEFKNEECKPPPPDYVGRAKSGATCALSGVWGAKSSLEVDHIKGNVRLQNWDDVMPFIRHLCPTKEELQLVTKHAHKIKSYAERLGLTYEEAEAAKFAIQLQKDKMDKEWLVQRGVEPGSNQKIRRQQIVKYALEDRLPW